MENEMESKRAAAIGELRAALDEIESGAGLTRFLGGHGIQSQVFEFEWDEPSLGMHFRLPCGRLLSDEETQKADDAEIGAAIRMAILLLSTVGQPGAAARLEVACNDHGPTYAVYGAGGDVEDSGADWAPLVKRLGAEFGASPESVSIIWP